MHFRISRFVSVSRRTRRFNERAVNYCAFAEEETSVGKLLLEQFKNLFIQTVFLKEMAKTQDRSFVRTFS